jgi:Na+/melibiose symporter-like transporter
MVTWVPAALLLASIAAAAAFPITRAVHRQLSLEASERRQAQA